MVEPRHPKPEVRKWLKTAMMHGHFEFRTSGDLGAQPGVWLNLKPRVLLRLCGLFLFVWCTIVFIPQYRIPEQT